MRGGAWCVNVSRVRVSQWQNAGKIKMCAVRSVTQRSGKMCDVNVIPSSFITVDAFAPREKMR